jgi:hypothetical protein
MLTEDSLIEWAASWVPDEPSGQRVRFAEALRLELAEQRREAERATWTAAEKLVADLIARPGLPRYVWYEVHGPDLIKQLRALAAKECGK